MEAVFSSSSTGFRIRAAQGQTQGDDQRPVKHGPVSSGFSSLVKNAVASLFFTFFPSDCRICGSPLIQVSQLPVCNDCLTAMHPLRGNHCSVCGEAMAGEWDAELHLTECGETRCLVCQNEDPPFERAVAYGQYDAGLRDLIHLLKFQQVRPAAKVLGHMLAEVIANLETAMPVGTIAVVPVPLYSRKRGERGFNQAEMIARDALKRLARPKRFELCARVLQRRRDTASQIGLDREQRRKNLHGAFAISDPGRILKRDVLLVDDVLTTGTTAAECARVLLKAGATRVWVATVARTLKILPRIGELEPESRERESVAVNG
jgi:ComF family protein